MAEIQRSVIWFGVFITWVSQKAQLILDLFVLRHRTSVWGSVDGGKNRERERCKDIDEDAK